MTDAEAVAVVRAARWLALVHVAHREAAELRARREVAVHRALDASAEGDEPLAHVWQVLADAFDAAHAAADSVCDTAVDHLQRQGVVEQLQALRVNDDTLARILAERHGGTA